MTYSLPLVQLVEVTNLRLGLSFLFFFRVWVILRSNWTLYQNSISHFEFSLAILREFSNLIALFALTSWKLEPSVKKGKILVKYCQVLGKNEILNQLFGEIT